MGPCAAARLTVTVLVAGVLATSGCSAGTAAPDQRPGSGSGDTATVGPALADKLRTCSPDTRQYRLVRSDAPRQFLLRVVVSRTVTGHHHILRTAQLVGAIVPTITPSALEPSRASILDQLGEQVPGLMPQAGPAPSPLLPETDATGVLVGYQGAARLAATFEVFCNGDYQGRGHLSSWGEDTVGLLDCATGAPPGSFGALAASYCPVRSSGGRSSVGRGGG